MIDVHTHPVQVSELHDRDPGLDRVVRDVFGLHMPPQPLRTFLGQMDAAGADAAVLLPIDCTVAHGCRIVSNEQIAFLMEQSDRLIGFASVDPGVEGAADVLLRDVAEYGLRGLKLDPALQQFDVGDRERAYPVYEACLSADIPLLIHCGLSWAPRGRAALARPIDLEPVIHDFPDLNIILAHFGWPWVHEALMLAIKHRSVHLDTAVLYSGAPHDSLARVVADIGGVDVIDRSLPEQVLFGSNYPRVDPKRVASAVRDLGLRPAMEHRLCTTNAARLLGLDRRP
ncbi:MAG: hypothetical protein PVS3B2_11000 [Candidatus Dormibacteraceae bacterium]